jgi:hypothetical protein
VTFHPEGKQFLQPVRTSLALDERQEVYGPEIEVENIYEGKAPRTGARPSGPFRLAPTLTMTIAGMPRDAESETEGSTEAGTLFIHQHTRVLRLHANRPAVPMEAEPPAAGDAPRPLLHEFQLSGHDRMADGFAKYVGVGCHGDAKIDTALRKPIRGCGADFQ